MLDRPDYVVCCCLGLYVEGIAKLINETWCGRKDIREFAFQDPAHAALNGRREGRLVLCRECRDAIVKALDNGFTESNDAN